MASTSHSTQHTAGRLLALAGTGLIRVQDALEAGITRGELRAAIAAGYVVRVAHSVIAVPGPDDAPRTLLQRCQAHASRRPSLVFCLHTANELLGQPLLRTKDTLLHAYDKHSARTGDLLIHAGGIPDDHVIEIHGLKVTSPLRTALDLARGLPLAEGLIPLDAALRGAIVAAVAHLGLPSDVAVESASQQIHAREQAEHVLGPMRHLHGARNARRALSLASPLAESPAESASRGHLLLAGIAPLGLQVRVLDGDGVERRLDFLLAEGLAGEVDGFIKYQGEDGPQAMRKEKRRDLALQRGGIFAVHWSAEESFWRPQRLIRVVRHALISHRRIA